MDEEKKKGFAKKFGITAAVLVVALGVGLGAYFAVSNNSKETAGITTNPPHEQQDPTTPIEPDEPVKEPGTPIEEPDEPPVEEPDPEEPIDEPDTPIEEPDEPEPDEPPVEEQAREDMIFFDDTGELNTEGFHDTLEYILANYTVMGMSINRILFERAYKDYEIIAVNYVENESTIYIYADGTKATSITNGNDREISIVKIYNIDLKDNLYENSLSKFSTDFMNKKRLEANSFYELAYHHTADENNDDYYKKAYEMAEHRMNQLLDDDEVIIGNFMKNKESYPAGLNIGNNVAYYTHFWVLNEKTNKITETSISVHTSSVLGEGSDKNLLNSQIDGSQYVVIVTNDTKDVVTLDLDTLYTVEGNKVSLLKQSTAKTEAVVYSDKKYIAYLPEELYRDL